MMTSLEKEIRSRFFEVIADHVGPGKKFRYKIKFAAAIGMLPQELHRIEQGEGSLQFRHIAALHKRLGIDLNWFIAGRENINVDKRAEKLRENIKKMVDQI